MSDTRYNADVATVIAAAAKKGIELSPDDIGKDLCTGVRLIDDMVWFEWLDAMTME